MKTFQQYLNEIELSPDAKERVWINTMTYLVSEKLKEKGYNAKISESYVVVDQLKILFRGEGIVYFYLDEELVFQNTIPPTDIISILRTGGKKAAKFQLDAMPQAYPWLGSVVNMAVEILERIK